MGEMEIKRREPRAEKKEKLHTIIRSNLILRLEVSWGHGVSLLKYKVREYQLVVL